MKNVLFISLILFLSSCASTKKSLETTIVKADSLGCQVVREVNVERYTDTTKTTSGRLVVTEIEFVTPDSTSGIIESLSINGNDVNVSGITGKAIRSIKQQTFESTSEEKGKEKESRQAKEQRQAVSIQKESHEKTKQLSPSPDPYKWRYIFYLSLVLLVGALYFKRMPIINWIKKLLWGLVKQ